MNKVFMITSEFNGSKVFLMYHNHVTFTNKVGFSWRSVKGANKRLAELHALKVPVDVAKVIANATIESFTEAEIKAIKSANTKVWVRAKGPLASEQVRFVKACKQVRYKFGGHGWRSVPSKYAFTRKVRDSRGHFMPTI